MRVILTHENADFDAIASLLGAHKLFPQARPILPHRINRNVQAFLRLYMDELPFVDPDALPHGQHIHRVILVDTQTIASVRGMSETLDEVLIIDHHTPPESLPDHWRFQGEQLGATTTMLSEAISEQLIPLSRLEATLLLAGIYEDTGALSYTSTTSRDMRAAAWLLDQGANLEIVGEFLHHPLSPGQQAIYEVLLDHAETVKLDGHPVLIAWARAAPGFDEEVSTLAHKLRDLLAPSALFILIELQGNTQIVARSSTDDINVGAVAQHFGGRGHDRAAAALIRDRQVQPIVDELQEILPYFVTPRVTVHDLMSHNVRTVMPGDTIKSVAQRMLHTGHEGFPVLDKAGRITGLVTRNAVDRALQHQWDHEPVRRIMEPGEVYVAPEDSAERVRTLMIQTGWGQIPVVTDDEVAGVVTRTDLIRLPPTEREAQRQRISQLMADAFPAPLLTLIRRIGTEAAEATEASKSGHTIYFVGGIVRDLLLRHPIFDVDLVVEGDAIDLGHKLAERYGGEVRTHRRFGTAKWLLPSDIWEQVSPEPPAPSSKAINNLPEFIDLVTARTEFYEHPTALPMVEWSSIKQDLHRRDFTINTLAIRLDPQHWGELLDFFGGEADLRKNVIRVLHSLSFVDDPTRILRAARFEARLNFRLDPRSEALIAEALPMLDRVTGGRIRHELDLIFQEAQPEAALDRLQALEALQQIDPALECDAWVHRAFTRLRQNLDPVFWTLEAKDLPFIHWTLWLYRLNLGVLQRIGDRLLMPRHYQDAFALLPALRETLPTLPQIERPSQVVATLETLLGNTYPKYLLPTAWIAADAALLTPLLPPESATQSTAIRAKLERYWQEWRHINPALTGSDLKEMGVPPGPVYRDILESLRAKRLDGEIATRKDEETWVMENLALRIKN
jgi:tRNA nucleotidyltransferase (CCA-adding enzyme)